MADLKFKDLLRATKDGWKPGWSKTEMERYIAENLALDLPDLPEVIADFDIDLGSVRGICGIDDTHRVYGLEIDGKFYLTHRESVTVAVDEDEEECHLMAAEELVEVAFPATVIKRWQFVKEDSDRGARFFEYRLDLVFDATEMV